ncbi:MAG TPA: CU044_2847 family protein [Edaphobacter sp.]
MARLAKFVLSDGSSIVAEVDDDSFESPRGVMRGGGASPEFIVKANETFDTALDRVRYAAETMLDRLTSLTRPPDEVAVEFGVKLNAETGAVIAKASTEANFKINLKWTRASSSNAPAPAAKE